MAFSLFYLKDAFICDEISINKLISFLRTFNRIPISAPINSSFLNSWTPSPLILAGLISDNVRRGLVIFYFKTIDLFGLVKQLKRINRRPSVPFEEDAEVGMNAMELLSESAFTEDATLSEQSKRLNMHNMVWKHNMEYRWRWRRQFYLFTSLYVGRYIFTKYELLSEPYSQNSGIFTGFHWLF